jgi:hypothetical protein
LPETSPGYFLALTMSELKTYAKSIEARIRHRMQGNFVLLLNAGLLAPYPASATIGPICALRFEQVMTDAVGCRLREEAKALKKGQSADFSRCQRKTTTSPGASARRQLLQVPAQDDKGSLQGEG